MNRGKKACLWLTGGFLTVVSMGRADMDVRIADKYPNLASGALTHAVISTNLPDDTLVGCGDVVIQDKDMRLFIESKTAYLRDQLSKNRFFTLEQLAAEKLLEHAAIIDSSGQKEAKPTLLVQAFIENLTTNVFVSEEDVQAFYKENEAVFCGAPLDQVRSRIEQFVLQEKKQQVLDDYIKNMGKNARIEINAKWLADAAARAKDNPIDRLRGQGKPLVAVFSASSCCGPDKMKPVMDDLRKAPGETIDMVYIQPREEPILAARYGIRSIPSLIIFDGTGKERYRHTGFMSAEDIRKKLASFERD